MKKIITFLLVLTFTMVLAPNLKADTAPKPTLDIYIKYESNRDIYIDLLIKKDLPSGDSEFLNDQQQNLDPLLYDYLKDNSIDGYISASIYNSTPFGLFLTETNDIYHLKATYRYPKTFKLLMYDKTNNSIMISKEFTQNIFHSRASVTFTKEFINETYPEITILNSIPKLTEKINYFKLSSSVIIRIIATLLIELIVLFLFRYKNKNTYINVGITNIVTQTILNIILLISYLFNGIFIYILYIIIGELIIITLESIYYMITLKEHSKKRALLYAITANALSILVSFLPFIY